MNARQTRWLGPFLLLAACETHAVAPKPTAGVSEQKVEEPAPNKSGPPLAKDRFRPYAPKPKEPLDFSGVDVGEGPLANGPDYLDALGQAIVAALNEGDAAA